MLPLLAARKWAAVEPVMKNLLTSNQPAELTIAAVALLKKKPGDSAELPTEGGGKSKVRIVSVRPFRT